MSAPSLTHSQVSISTARLEGKKEKRKNEELEWMRQRARSEMRRFGNGINRLEAAVNRMKRDGTGRGKMRDTDARWKG